MRTLLFILGGFVLLAVCLGLGKSMAGSFGDGMRVAVIAFAALWFVIAAVNMWMGIAKAGYSFGEELPIFLLIYLLPLAGAAFVVLKWKLF
ncbi:MAG: hypothetical protein J7549_11430 [Variovorax sp.]|nr:hypothetical protein [Variovorax sp.]